MVMVAASFLLVSRICGENLGETKMSLPETNDFCVEEMMKKTKKFPIFTEPFYVYEAMLRYCNNVIDTTLDCRKCSFSKKMCDQRYTFARYMLVSPQKSVRRRGILSVGISAKK